MFWSVDSIIIILTVGVSLLSAGGFIVGAVTERLING